MKVLPLLLCDILPSLIRLKLTRVYIGHEVKMFLTRFSVSQREVSRDRERDKKRDQEDEEEAYDRRKLERKLRDKEAAYQEVGTLGRTSWLPTSNAR